MIKVKQNHCRAARCLSRESPLPLTLCQSDLRLTSIDALSVGFTIAEYELIFAVTESLIIGIVTFGLCLAGLLLGGRIGSRISGKAGIVGGIILILIGTEIFVTGII